jgi:nicotinamide-nucleotide amidase
LGGNQVIRHHRVKCFGVGESDLEQMLPDLIRRGRTPTVGITVSDATITLRITAQGSSADECAAQIEPTLATIHECLGRLVFGREDDELEHVVARLLSERRETLATCEAGTEGLIADWLGDVPEGRDWYLGGIVARTNGALERALGLSDELLARHHPASAEVAETMAVACRARFGSHYALAVSPFPPYEPHGGAPGRVHFALASAQGVVVKSATFAGHSAILKSRAAKQALDLFRQEVLSHVSET